jgi:hypothetical protein
MEQWEKNFYISAIAGANNGSSLVVMSKGSGSRSVGLDEWVFWLGGGQPQDLSVGVLARMSDGVMFVVFRCVVSLGSDGRLDFQVHHILNNLTK